jgi:hypothetical protein
MYPFNSANPLGSEADCPIFAPFGNSSYALFDDRDSQMIVGFDTAADFNPGLGTTMYRVLSATLTTTVSPQSVFAYDPTPDSWKTYSQFNEPPAINDTDPGRSIELYLVGYRAGWSLTTFQEDSRFKQAAGDPPNPNPFPATLSRNAFAAEYSPAGSGLVRDISNNVDNQFEPRPLAVGLNPTLTPGQSVPVGTRFTFDVDFANPDARRYLREGLNSGRLNFAVSSLAEAQQQNPQTVRMYCKEAGVPGTAPTLSIRVCIGSPGDWDCSGIKDADDLFAFLDEWFAGTADFNEDGLKDADDLFAFLDAWFAV